MFPPWFNLLSWLTLLLGMLCAAVVIADEIRKPQSMAIMNVVWPMTALFGTVAVLALYFRFGRETRETREEEFAVSVAKSTLHCGSGCALGDLVAEWSAFAFPAIAVGLGWGSLFRRETYAVWILDFLVAFALGIVFQYWAIAPMHHSSRAGALLTALKADSLSLLTWQLGMYGCMACLQFFVFPKVFHTHAAVDSSEFWFAMQVAMLAGFATSYPMNWWLVRSGIKHAM